MNPRVAKQHRISNPTPYRARLSRQNDIRFAFPINEREIFNVYRPMNDIFEALISLLKEKVGAHSARCTFRMQSPKLLLRPATLQATVVRSKSAPFRAWTGSHD